MVVWKFSGLSEQTLGDHSFDILLKYLDHRPWMQKLKHVLESGMFAQLCNWIRKTIFEKKRIVDNFRFKVNQTDLRW